MTYFILFNIIIMQTFSVYPVYTCSQIIMQLCTYDVQCISSYKLDAMVS